MLQVEDLPRLWNEKMEKYLGIVPPSDAEGVLQVRAFMQNEVFYTPTTESLL